MNEKKHILDTQVNELVVINADILNENVLT